MPTPVLATKLFAPTRRAGAVPRPVLTERLDATVIEGHRLTLVAAPAGFGKTTLLGEWCGGVRRRHPRTATGWLSLDEGDNDPARWATHLAAALERLGLAVGTDLDPLREGPTAAMTALVNGVTRLGEEAGPEQRWVLVLDDYHVVVAPEVHEAVTFLVDHLPDRLHLVVSTRADPPLPLSRLRARGQLVELRAADLRLTADEAGELLDGVARLALTAEEVRSLHERTEGWAAGLQLAALALRGMPERGDVTAFVEAFTGSHRFVIDYLADEVLDRLAPRTRGFLLRTAVLDRLTGPLCDAVTGGSGGAELLEQLDRGNLFLVPLDDHRGWYRYHQLFADVLDARLRAEHPDDVPELHRRAGAWYAAHGLVEDAVRHALDAGDVDRAARLMEEALPELRRRRQDGLMLAWVRSLPDTVVRRSPVLSITAGWGELVSGNLEEVEARLGDAEAALATGDTDEAVRASWADTEDLRIAPATIAVYRASLCQARGDVEGTVRHARLAWDLARPEDHVVRGAAGGFLGLAAWAAGDVRRAVATFADAVRSLHAAGNLVDELDSTVVLADIWVACGRPSQARRLYERALEEATRGGRPYPRATADLHVGLAELDREQGDLASAEAHLEAARVLREHGSITENRHRWFVAGAWVRFAQGAFDEATRLLDEAEVVYRRGFYPDLRPLAAMKARVRIGAGDLEAAAAWAEDRGLSLDDEADYQREYEHLTLVRLVLARARHERRTDASGAASRVASVLPLLDRLAAAASEAGREGSLEEIRLLQAVAHGRGDLEASVLGREGGVEPPRQALADPLSRREVEVLRLLDSDLTGPEIARALYVTVNTLRTHTKRIFTKLEVSTRAAAVRRAHEDGLL